MPLPYITVHLRLEHQLGPNDLHPVVMQLCRIFSAEHTEDPHCDHCGALLPTLDILEFDPVPEIHLPGCPLIQHLAAFLMHPVLHKPQYDSSAWPSPQAIEAAFQRQEHQRLMFNARNLDSAGREFDLLVSCGLQLLNDELILETISTQCLICHKLLILPGALAQHVKQHDYKQYNTLWVLRRLQLINPSCPCCGSELHEDHLTCPALLNLAVSCLPMGDALDRASSIWANLLTQGQLQSLGIKDEDDAKPNKRPRRKERSTSTSTSSDNTKAMVQVMAKILLRHEDSLHVLLQEYEFVLWIQPGEGSLLPILMACHLEWQKGSKSTSLRHSMALCMIETLKERLDKLQKAPASADVVQDCIKFHLIDANQMMPFLRWDAGAQQLLPTKDKPLPIGEVSRIIQTIHHILQSEPEITLRFHSLSKAQMAEESGKAVPFLWTVGSRTQGELWNLLRTVSFHSIWQLVRLTLRPQTRQRTALAKQLGKMM